MKKKNQPPIAQNYVYSQAPAKYTKKCKYCRQLIDKKARICPYCHKTIADGCSGILLAVFTFICILFIFFFFFS